MFLPFFFPLRHFLVAHAVKWKQVIPNVKSAVVIFVGHGQALSRTDSCAKSAEHALAHVNVEFLSVNSFWRPVSGLAEGFRRANRHYVDAIDRTNLCAFITDDTIIDFIMQFISSMVRDRDRLMRKLKGGRARIGFKEIFFQYVLISLFPDLKKVTERNP